MIVFSATVLFCMAIEILAPGTKFEHPHQSGLVSWTVSECATRASDGVSAPCTEGPDGLTVLALSLAALVPTFVLSQFLLLLIGPKPWDLVLAHSASLAITGFSAGTIFTTESGFAGSGALALVAAPQLFWLLIDLVRVRSNPTV